MVVKEKILNGWHVILYDPKDIDNEEKSILIDEKYQNMSQVYDGINETLVNHGLKMPITTMIKYANGSYNGKNTTFSKVLSITKCKIKIKITTKIES